MAEVKAIFFDCMETLVDMHYLPGVRDYAIWSYEGTDAERFWPEREDFIADYYRTRDILRAPDPQKEFLLQDYYRYLLTNFAGVTDESAAEIVMTAMIDRFWERYHVECFAAPITQETLARLSRHYPLAVVSNFLLRGAVEELLTQTGLTQYFQEVVTSADTGWRKPSPHIYTAALALFEFKPEDVLFVGDDIENDYYGPKKVGLPTILYDPYDRHPEISARVLSLGDIPARLGMS
jgi:putative hydrolase of the HAD superfamily